MGKRKVDMIKCHFKNTDGTICGKTSELYPCPYCGDGEGNGGSTIYCKEHLKQHLNDYAFGSLELVE